MTIVVNVSDARASNDPAAVLATYSLGSCIGVSLYDPLARVGGMLHFQLPTASLDADKAQRNPMMFADSGMKQLTQMMARLGAEPRRLKVKMAGGAQMLADGNLFNIGRRNHAAIRKILWQTGLLIEAEEVGGSRPRNLYLNVADGTVSIKAGGTSTTM